MNIENIRQHPVKTLLQFAIPCIISMLLETIITITDGYFTGNYVGEEALAAINLGLPVLYFYLGTGLCVGVGGSVICGKFLGAGKTSDASGVFSQTITTSLIISVLVSLVFGALFTPILRVLRADGNTLSTYFTQYYQVMLLAYPLMVLGTILAMFIRADGKPQLCMFVSIGACLINIIGDYILMCLCHMGITGSAIATLATQALTVLAELIYFFLPATGLRFVKYRFDRAVCKDTFLNGSSEFIGEMASAISMFAFNYVLMQYVGTEGVTAFTVLGFSVYGYSMITLGFGQGLTTPVSFLWGAGETSTAVTLRKITNHILFVIGALFAVSFWLFGRKYAQIFGCGNAVADMVATGFRFFTITFMVMGYDVINSMYFTGCGDALSSAVISSLRGIVFLLAFTFIFPALWGMNGVWLVTPVTESLTVIVSFFLIRKQQKQLNKPEQI